MYTKRIKEYPFKYSFLKEIVGPQISSISSNKDLAKSVVTYINKEDKSKMSDKCFHLLIKLFNQNAYRSEINEEFIMYLFEGLSIVREEALLRDIVFILIEINYEYSNPEENIILKVHKENDNSRVLNELLLRVLNSEHDAGKKNKILKCLNDLMSSYTKSIFYESDLEIFIDILLSKLQMTDNNDLKKKLLECLDRVTKYNEYYGNMYKADEITELMEHFESVEEQPEEIRNISKQIVINITDTQGKNKNIKD